MLAKSALQVGRQTTKPAEHLESTKRLYARNAPTMLKITFPPVRITSHPISSIPSSLIISIRRMRRTLRTIEPLNVPQPPPNLPLLQLRTRQLLLLARAELHIAFIATAGRGTISRRRSGADLRAGDGGGDGAGAWSGVVEAVEGDGQVALLGQAAGFHVPLLWAQGADEFFVVRDHDYSTFVFADGDRETSDRVTVQEVGWFVEDE